MGIPSRKGEEGAEKDPAKRVTSSFLPQQVLCPQEKIILEVRPAPEEQEGWVPRGLPGGRSPLAGTRGFPDGAWDSLSSSLGPALLPKGNGDLGPPGTEGAPPCGGTQRDLSVLSEGARGRRRSLQRLG